MKQPELGKRITELRKAKGLTQEELIEKCKISIRTLQRIESGKVIPRNYTLKEISVALDCKLFDPLENNKGKGLYYSLKYFFEHVYKSINDLFNLKTHKMQKLSILTGMAIMIVSGLFIAFSDCHAQELTVKNYFHSHERGLVVYFPKIKGSSMHISNVKDTADYRIRSTEGECLLQEHKGNIFLNGVLMGHADPGDTVILKKESLFKKPNIVFRKVNYGYMQSINGKKIIYAFPEPAYEDLSHGCIQNIEETFEIDGSTIKEHLNKIFFNGEYMGDAFENDTVILRKNQLSILKFKVS